MVSDGQMITDVAERLLTARLDDEAWRRSQAGEWLSDLWDAFVEMGLPLALVPEGKGGFGIPIRQALDIVRLTGCHALPLPLAETMIANWLLAQAGLPLADGPATLLPTHDARAAWGRHATVFVVQGPLANIARLNRATVATAGFNIAGLPRDMMIFDTPAVNLYAPVPSSVLQAGAAMRTLQIAGALESVLEMTIAYVSERQQFGRALSKFQAVQHELAKLAGDVAAASAAADMVADAMAESRDLTVPVAAARARSGEAVGSAVAIAQQLHGAIGFTREHRLHRFTTALWSWRDEFGSQQYWTQLLGAAVLAPGTGDFWPFVTEAA